MHRTHSRPHGGASALWEDVQALAALIAPPSPRTQTPYPSGGPSRTPIQ